MSKTQGISYEEIFSPVIKNCFEDQGKYLIDNLGNILLKHDTNLSFSITPNSNLLTFLSKLNATITTEHLAQIVVKKNQLTAQFSFENELEETKNHFKLLLSSCGGSEQQLFLVEILDQTSFYNLQQKQQKQLDRLESEIALRTREIMNTKEVMDMQGGYLHNFLRGLRHDLISPISQLKEIISYYKKAEDSEKKEKAGILIDDSLDKLTITARGFSDFVDIHLLDHHQTEVCNFEAIFEEIKSLLEPEINTANANFTTNFEAVKEITFNKKELTSLLYNLLSNALKFRDLNRNLIIEFETKLQDKHIVIHITDNGVGMDYEKYKDQLFRPFKRMNTTQPGAGVGLSLVKHILDKNNGKIQIESELGAGMKVEVKFPIDGKGNIKPNLVAQQNK